MSISNQELGDAFEEAINVENSNWKAVFAKNKKETLHALAKNLVEQHHVKTLAEARPRNLRVRSRLYRLGVNDLRGEIQAALEELATTQMKSEVIDQVRDLTITKREDFDVSPDLINLENGIFNIVTGELLSHDRATCSCTGSCRLRSQRRLPNHQAVPFGILSDEDVPVIQEWFGYALYRKYFIKKAIIFVGERDTGKTTLLNLLGALSERKHFGGQPPEARLRQVRSRSALQQAPQRLRRPVRQGINDNGTFKIATGNGIFTGEYKFGDAFQFVNHAKLTYSCNKIPNVNDTATRPTSTGGSWCSSKNQSPVRTSSH